MTTKIVNLTQRLVNREVERVLNQYPHRPYQQAFANPKLRRRLVAYVLSRVRNYYVTVNSGQESQVDVRSQNLSVQQQQLENLVHQGIQSIVRNNADYVQSHIPRRSYNPHNGSEPSHWFG